MTVENNVPEIRFKGFSDEWANKNIGDIFQVVSGATPLRSDARFFENADVSWVKTTDLNNGVILKTEEMISQTALVETSVKILPKGTVFVAMYGGFNQIGRTGLLETEATCNQALSAIYPNDKIVPYYLLTYLNLNVDAWKDLAASSRKDPNITKSDVLAFPFLYPSIKEQTQIGNTFRKLDSLIKQHQQKHDKLSNIKKAMLDKMFPKQGETIPEIRFKGFSGEWAEKELGEIGSFVSGVGFSESEQSGRSGTPFFKVSDMNLIGNDCYMVTANNYVNDEQISRLNYTPVRESSILFAKVGAAIFLERKRIAKDFLMDNNMMAFSPTQDLTFMKQWFDSISLAKYTQVGALPSFKASDLGKIKLKVPKREEQTAIGNYFQKLDALINQHQQQITKLKNIKLACLSKMFV